MKRKICHCGEKSVPGLKPGMALCQYHYNAHMWGKEWADKCAALAKTTNPAPTR